MLNKLRKRFKAQGRFNVKIDQNITMAAKINHVPNELGVYIVYEEPDCKGMPIYIGKAGTIENDGSKKKQGIINRLGKKQKNMPRNKYFKKIMKENGKGISVAWFVTYAGKSSRLLPAFVEAELIQNFFEKHGRLPKHNKNF